MPDHRTSVFRAWVLVTLMMYETVKGQNFEDEDADLNVLLNKIQEFQEETRNMNNHVLKKISELKAGIQKLEDRIPNVHLQPGGGGVASQAANNGSPDGDPSKYLAKIENRLNQINGISMATQKSNKAVMDMLSKSIGPSAAAQRQNSVLPDDVKKEIAERISSEFIQMREWMTKTVDRVSGMEKRCASLTKSIENTKDQCVDRLGEQVQSDGLENFKEEVRKNFSRVERDLKSELEKMVQNMEWKAPATPPAPEVPKTTEVVLPTFPPPIPERFPVNIPCNSRVMTKRPVSCADVQRRGGVTCDGTYVIYPRKKKAHIVLCDMNTLGGGWTVIMRRGQFPNGHLSFHQPWSAYKQGFGRTKGEFWVGNEYLHLLTASATKNTNDSQQLLVQVESFQGEQLNLIFDFIYVEDEQHSYRLHLGNVSGNFGMLASPLSLLNNRIFRTYDRNEGEENCASQHGGGWWFDDSCDHITSVLTSPLFQEADVREHWQGIRWPTWKPESVLKSAQMKIRTKEDHE